MQEYTIDVSEIEELQTIKNKRAIDRIFTDAKSTLVNGETVWLVRKSPNRPVEKFDEITTLPDLEAYKKNVYKYL